MSEFECSNGHPMSGITCKICGEPASRMDGFSARELKRMDEAPDHEEEREEEY